MKSSHFVRRVNLRRMRPVVDPFTRRGPARTDPDELPPPCGNCRGFNTLWFIDRRTTGADLICLDCTPHREANDLPEVDIPHERGEERAAL